MRFPSFARSPARRSRPESGFSTGWDFLGILRDGISVIQPDVSDAGGISETRRIAAMAETYDVTVAPHCPLGPIALAASLQIDFATPNILIQEQSISFSANGSSTIWWIAACSTSRTAGSRDRQVPGLGIEIDEKAVEEAAARGFECRTGSSTTPTVRMPKSERLGR